jgi:predicted transcriptional regulator
MNQHSLVARFGNIFPGALQDAASSGILVFLIWEGGQMASAKEQMLEVLRNQPDDSSYNELLRELAFVQMVERGVADSDAGRTISHEDMLSRIRSWQR